MNKVVRSLRGLNYSRVCSKSRPYNKWNEVIGFIFFPIIYVPMLSVAVHGKASWVCAGHQRCLEQTSSAGGFRVNFRQYSSYAITHRQLSLETVMKSDELNSSSRHSFPTRKFAQKDLNIEHVPCPRSAGNPRSA